MTMYDSPHVNAVRRKLTNLMRRGVSSVTRMAERSGQYKNTVYHHLSQFRARGKVVKIGREYYLRSYVLQHQRRFIGKLREERDSIIENNVTRRFRPGVLGRRVKQFRRKKWDLRDLGIQVHVDLGPEYILREKRQYAKQAIEQPRALSRNEGRKFEQLHEYRDLVTWVEGFFRYDVPDDLRSVPIDNPMARQKVESLPSVRPA